MNNESVKAIQVLLVDVDKHIKTLGVKNISNLYDYKFNDLLHINNIIRVCARCNTEFIPRFGSHGTQIFCGDDCRYNSTQETRKEIKQDPRYKEIDKLRKLIYERRYRDRIGINPITVEMNNEYEKILTDLRVLTKNRHTLSENEFKQQFAELKRRYRLQKSF